MPQLEQDQNVFAILQINKVFAYRYHTQFSSFIFFFFFSFVDSVLQLILPLLCVTQDVTSSKMHIESNGFFFLHLLLFHFCSSSFIFVHLFDHRKETLKNNNNNNLKKATTIKAIPCLLMANRKSFLIKLCVCFFLLSFFLFFTKNLYHR